LGVNCNWLNAVIVQPQSHVHSVSYLFTCTCTVVLVNLANYFTYDQN